MLLPQAKEKRVIGGYSLGGVSLYAAVNTNLFRLALSCSSMLWFP